MWKTFNCLTVVLLNKAGRTEVKRIVLRHGKRNQSITKQVFCETTRDSFGGSAVVLGESSEAGNAEAPGSFDDPLRRRAAHFEASQLKFKGKRFHL